MIMFARRISKSLCLRCLCRITYNRNGIAVRHARLDGCVDPRFRYCSGRARVCAAVAPWLAYELCRCAVRVVSYAACVCLARSNLSISRPSSHLGLTDAAFLRPDPTTSEHTHIELTHPPAYASPISIHASHRGRSSSPSRCARVCCAPPPPRQ